MAQDNAEMSTKFSTLNVNAAEFVPSFTSFSAAASTALSTDNTPAVTIAPMDTASVPASTSGTPATTPNSEASGSGSTNALSQADVPPAESPMQTSPIKTAAAAAPVENINTADKIATNNGNGKYIPTILYCSFSSLVKHFSLWDKIYNYLTS